MKSPIKRPIAPKSSDSKKRVDEVKPASPLGQYAKAKPIAVHFGLHPKTVHRWAARGLIHGRKLNARLTLFEVAEVIALIESARVA